MTKAVIPLAEGFAAATEAQWRALVDKTIAGADFSEKLVSHLAGGQAIQPLYPAAPRAEPLFAEPRDTLRPWDLRTLVAHPDPARARSEILADLEGGAASVVLAIDPTGVHGTAVGSPEALAEALDGVVLELAPVALDAGFLGAKAADWLGAAAKASPNALLSFHLDPLSALAVAGRSPGPIESHLIGAATVASRLTETYPRAGLFLASGQVVHEAGGDEALELGFAAASALAYAKALTRAGVPTPDALARIVLGLAADSDYFVTIAKLRAARRIWARLSGALGGAAPARIEARSSRRMLTRLDPWTNMLRLTSAGFGAAVGGADAVVLGAFTDALGLPTPFARRQARNAQLVLMEEASLGRVFDPSAGSGFLETLTDQIARAGWAAFQAIEAGGGIVAALASGSIAAKAAETLTARRQAVETKASKILGVTVFPNAQPGEVAIETADAAAFAVNAPSPRLPGPDTVIDALPQVRLAAPFEEVR
ncbi:MAG: methylmalonyl-CoA mutase family protein [Caulobacteraceae bacterium]|nr:methylmalonyl-CoA mutase family protein [Caulobacteraceae bacterium]